MHFNVHTPCPNCPFRKDVKPFITKKRAIEIVDNVINDGKTFACHKTLGKRMVNRSHCAGAIELIKKADVPHFALAMGRSLGIYKEEDYKSPHTVYSSPEEFIEAHS